MRKSPNPLGRRTVGDCSVRAVAKALGISWDKAHDMLADMSKKMGTVMNDNDVISAVLRIHGFYKESFPWTCKDCYTVKEFAQDNPVGTYVAQITTSYQLQAQVFLPIQHQEQLQ